MRATLIIPTFNEAPVIVPTLTLLRDAFACEHNFEYQIIVVDNGSNDGTGEEVLGMNDEHIQLLRLEKKGKGNAIRAALRKSNGDVVGFTDVDLPIPPKEILAAMKLIMEDVVDVAVGSRLLPESKSTGREWWRTASSRAFNFFARLIVGINASDAQCPFKVMNAKGLELLLATKEPTWFFDVEFFALLEHLPIRVREVPVTWYEHRYPKRSSKLSLWDSLRAIAAMFRIKIRPHATLHDGDPAQ